MAIEDIDIRQPRLALYRQLVGHPGECPRCGGELRQHYQSYVIVSHTGSRLADPFMVGSTFGWFCVQCPVVVINSREVGALLGHARSDWDVGAEWTVLGLLDLDAVPEEKRSLPLGTGENPLPLVRFLQETDGGSGLSAAKRRPKAKKGAKKKRGKPRRKLR
jgi:hypothetical protein